MKSGLEGRNNPPPYVSLLLPKEGLNEVRPRRPEQCVRGGDVGHLDLRVSMKSGLEGRNNEARDLKSQLYLNVSMKSGLEGRNNMPATFCGSCRSRTSQ